MSRVLNLLILFAAGMVVLILAIPLYLTWINIQPAGYGDRGPRPLKDYETLSVTTTDGVPIKTWLLKGNAGAPCVIVIHGKGNTKSGMLYIASKINHAGFNVLLPDLRGHGESGDATVTLGLNEVRDIEAVMAAVKNRADIDTTRIGVLGQSMGSAVAIRSFAGDPAVKGFVIDSGFGSLDALLVDVGVSVYNVPRWLAALSNISYRILIGENPSAVNPAKALSKSKAPVLFFHARSDLTIPLKHGHALYEAAGGKKVFIETDGDHAGCWGAGPLAYEIYVTEFFKRAFSESDFDPLVLLECDTSVAGQ